MRSGCDGIRVGRRRCGVLTAALALVACGDNEPPPRLSLARFVYDDGSEQIDRVQLYDRDLKALCSPRVMSDGSTYCMPDAGDAIYVDANCVRVVGRVPIGNAPPPFFATHYTMNGVTLPSRVFGAGNQDVPSTERYERRDGECLGPFTNEEGFDYYSLKPQVELERVRFVDSGNVQELVADGVHMPWRFAGCSLVAAPNQPSTTCAPADAALISYYIDTGCRMPVIHGSSRPSLGFVEDTGCRQYFEVGNELLPPPVFERVAGNCVMSSVIGSPRFFTVSRPTSVPRFTRMATGDTRLQPITIGPLVDQLMHDRQLGTDCLREPSLRCMPAGTAPVETWFADALCGTPVEVAMVGSSECAAPAMFARKGDVIYRVGAPYSEPLYQLEPGDRCGLYVPPLEPHKLGAALPTDAFPRATLVNAHDP